MRPSKLFDPAFAWHCRDGLGKEFKRIRKEFVTYRAIRPIKIAIIGPPLSGRTTLANLISSELRAYIINVKDVLEYYKKGKDQLAKQLQRQEEELKDKYFEECEKAKKKPTEDRETMQVYFPDRTLGKLVRRRLNTEDYKLKGFIMDGYPKSIKHM